MGGGSAVIVARSASAGSPEPQDKPLVVPGLVGLVWVAVGFKLEFVSEINIQQLVTLEMEATNRALEPLRVT